MLLKMVSRLLAQHVPVLTLTGNQRPGASVPPLAPMYSPLPPTIDLKTSVNAFMDHVLDMLDEMGIRYHHQPITTRGQRLRSTTVVKFGVLFNDDRCANIFEALVGTLRAAKKRKVLTYDGELLLQGVHDNVEITLLPPPAVAAA